MVGGFSSYLINEKKPRMLSGISEDYNALSITMASNPLKQESILLLLFRKLNPHISLPFDHELWFRFFSGQILSYKTYWNTAKLTSSNPI